MTTDRLDDNLLEMISNTLMRLDKGGIRTILETFLNGVMALEREEAIGAKPYERTESRLAYANGFKPKEYKTCTGTLQLEIPQVRGIPFYPQSLEKGSRSERALKLAIAEMYIQGVSTRRVTKITEAMCGLSISSSQVSRLTKELDAEFELFRTRLLGRFLYLWLDATYIKVRRNGHVQSVPVLIASGIDNEGYRQIVGISMRLSEAEVHWRSFLEDLLKRGLTGMQLVVSDDHPGLRQALHSVMPSVLWQRCQFHLSQNAQSYSPTKEMREEIGSLMREIYSCSKLKDAERRISEIQVEYKEKAPEFVQWLGENGAEGLTVYELPAAHQKRMRTVNPLERLNREIKRRTRVVGVFPNIASALRLVTGILSEIHEEWVSGRRYLDVSIAPEKKSAAQAA